MSYNDNTREVKVKSSAGKIDCSFNLKIGRSFVSSNEKFRDSLLGIIQQQSGPQSQALDIIKKLGEKRLETLREMSQTKESFDFTIDGGDMDLSINITIVDDHLFVSVPMTTYDGYDLHGFQSVRLNFIGREKYIDLLCAKFDKKIDFAKNARKIIISGLSGTGKTYIALHFGYNFCKDYKFRCWFNATSSKMLRAEYITFGLKYNLFPKYLNESRKVLAVKEWFETHPGWFLVYDDARNYKQIKDYLPRKGGGILITTKNSNWDGAESVDMMTEDEAIKMIKTIAGCKITKYVTIERR